MIVVQRAWVFYSKKKNTSFTTKYISIKKENPYLEIDDPETEDINETSRYF